MVLNVLYLLTGELSTDDDLEPDNDHEPDNEHITCKQIEEVRAICKQISGEKFVS